MTIKFGTDGWRGVIAEEFTFQNVRRCAQGTARYFLGQGTPGPLVVGYDTRFASGEFAVAVAEVLSGNGLRCLLGDEATPTPVVSYNVVARQAAGAVIITASHNPAHWNGFKVRTAQGGSAPPEVLEALERHIQQVAAGQIASLPLAEGVRQGLVERASMAPVYREHLARLVDLGALQRAGLRVVVDAMHGAGAGYFGAFLEGGKTWLKELRGERNPAFPGMHNPEPVAHNLAPLSRAVVEERADIGLALDGDADRLGVMDESGRFLTPLQVFALLALYFLEVRGERGPIIKSLTSSSMVYRLGERYGVPVYETPVGFKYIAPLMVEKGALLGGEESGGFGFRGHIPERDGILSGLLLLDMMVRLGKSPSQLLDTLHQMVGPHHYRRVDIPFPAERRATIQQQVQSARPDQLGGKPVERLDDRDGFRFVLRGGAWLVIRFSGTEPLLRIYAEAESPQQVEALLAAGRDLAGV
ncbi:MAG: phosphoglucomutase/phosphomannomutase family protein [Chloroflexi bacterium]|nr:phosphoglucomutase/phosphomannomutase family protein [Chloroflexota bacterium]